MRVGLIGWGTIGQGVAALLRPEDEVELVGAVVRDPNKPRAVHLPVFSSVDGLLECKPELVVECGGHEALACHGPAVLGAGIDLMLLSVGALARPAVQQALIDAAVAGHSQAIVLSGGIGALDAIASATVGGLARVTHTTRKPARALLDEGEALTEPKELFCGTAREGALRFPENINVAAAVSLAGVGLDATVVRVTADPSIERNTHDVVAEGAFGTLRFSIQNIPTDNPRTGRLVAMSVVHALRKRSAPLVIG
jgi:aspartate dehydrogenase